MGNVVPGKVRLIVDLRRSGVNDLTVNSVLSGQVHLPQLDDIAKRLLKLQRENPGAVILMRVLDIDAAFRRMGLGWEAVRSQAYTILGVCFLMLVACFGWSDSPAYFQHIGLLVAQLYLSYGADHLSIVFVDDNMIMCVARPGEDISVLSAAHEQRFLQAMSAVCGDDAFNRVKDKRDTLSQWGSRSSYVGWIWDLTVDTLPEASQPVGAVEAALLR